MPEHKFKIPSYETKIKAEDKYVYSLLSIVIEREDLYDLSPDSTYFIPLKIESVSNYSINEAKGNTLIRIHRKNKYAETIRTTSYNLAGLKIDKDGLESTINFTKPVRPLTNNQVRMAVGNLDADTKKLESIQSIDMIVTVDENNKLSIAPYAPEAELLEVELLPPPDDKYLYNNRFEELPNPYNSKKFYQRFLLHYKYRNKAKKEAKWSDWIEIAESTSRDVYIE